MQYDGISTPKTARWSFAPESSVTACRSVSFWDGSTPLLTFEHRRERTESRTSGRERPESRTSVHLGASTPEQFPAPSSPHVTLQRSASTPPLSESADSSASRRDIPGTIS